MTMFDTPRYLQNSFSLIFPRQLNIRRLANEFEDKLKEYTDLTYSQPQVISVPDELDPEIPRLIFGSKRGSSQIVISQLSIVLNVVYTPDWQIDISKGRRYLLKRVLVLFDLLSILGDIQPLFAGLATTIRLPAKDNNYNIIKHLSDIFLKNFDIKLIHDIQLKFTSIINDKYYSNLTISNYRTWNLEEKQAILKRLPKDKVSACGIQIVGDFNDRYAFNEKEGYFTDKSESEIIIDKGFYEIEKIIEKARG